MTELQPNLSRIIGFRVSKTAYDRLEDLRKNSNCQTLGEFVRAIVLKERINWYHKDASFESLALEFAHIRKELNAIGKNINQITRMFHHAEAGAQKVTQAIRAEVEYKKVQDKVTELLKLMGEVTTRWSQK